MNSTMSKNPLLHNVRIQYSALYIISCCLLTCLITGSLCAQCFTEVPDLSRDYHGTDAMCYTTYPHPPLPIPADCNGSCSDSYVSGLKKCAPADKGFTNCTPTPKIVILSFYKNACTFSPGCWCEHDAIATWTVKIPLPSATLSGDPCPDPSPTPPPGG
jgi:hypothetical protein